MAATGHRPTPEDRTRWNRAVVTWADQSAVRYRQALKVVGWAVQWWEEPGGWTEPLSLDQLAARCREHWPAVAQSRRTLARIMAELGAAGVVQTARTGQRPGVRNGANRYRPDFHAVMAAGAIGAGQRDFGTAANHNTAGQADFGTASPAGTAVGTAVGTANGTANPRVAAGQSDFGTAYGSTVLRDYVDSPRTAKPVRGSQAEAGEPDTSAPTGAVPTQADDTPKRASEPRPVAEVTSGSDETTPAPPPCERHVAAGPSARCRDCAEIAAEWAEDHREPDPLACARHAGTGYGPRQGCPDCDRLAAGTEPEPEPEPVRSMAGRVALRLVESRPEPDPEPGDPFYPHRASA